MNDRHGPRMICPRCGIEQPRAIECANCGIVVAKFQRNRPRFSPPTPKQAGIGALLILVAALVVAVMVWFSPKAPPPAPPPPAARTVESPGQVPKSQAETLLDERWSSGAVGFRSAVQSQQERKVAMFVWIRPADCPSCGPVEDTLLKAAEAQAWLAQNERVRLNADSDADKAIIEKLAPEALPAAFVVRSNGERKAVVVFQAGTTTPLSPAEFVKGLRAAAGS